MRTWRVSGIQLLWSFSAKSRYRLLEFRCPVTIARYSSSEVIR
jgi:hypothetical protein